MLALGGDDKGVGFPRAMALMAILATVTLWYVTRNPIDERILVDEQTRSVVWTRVYQGNRLDRKRDNRDACQDDLIIR